MDTARLKQTLDQALETIRQLDDNKAINRIVEKIITDLTGAEFASVWINDYPRLIREREDGVRELSLEEKKGLLYKCYVTQESAIYNYITSEKGYVSAIDNPDNIRIKSKMTIPVIYEERLVGIVTCYSSVRRAKNYTTKDLEKFKTITPFVIDAICKMLTNMGREPLKKRDEGEECVGANVLSIANNVEKIESRSLRDERQAMMDMAAQIVHDIRTPAGNLIGFLEILEEHIEDRRLREYVGYAKNSAELINTLTTSLLDSFKLSQLGEKGVRRQKVSTPSFFAEIAHIFSANMFEKRIGFHIYIDPLLPAEIEVDTMKLKRVIMNLLGNALKFTPEGGHIHFAVHYDADKRTIKVSVKDSGIGIPKERQKEIFKPYTQADEATYAKYGGTGLGLAICADYVRQMGGELELQSELDRGSEFYFTVPVGVGDAPRELPVVDARTYVTILLDKEGVEAARNLVRYLMRLGLSKSRIKAVRETASIEAETTHLVVMQSLFDESIRAAAKERGWQLMVVEQQFLSLDAEKFEDVTVVSQYGFYGSALAAFVAKRRPARVLIVEDDRISVALLTTMLKEEYCSVDVAHDGSDGLFLLREALEAGRPYDVVYTDMQMPGMSGVEMLRAYRALEKEKGAGPIRAVSISGDPKEVANDGTFDYFANKPFKKDEIKKILTQYQGVSHATTGTHRSGKGSYAHRSDRLESGRGGEHHLRQSDLQQNLGVFSG